MCYKNINIHTLHLQSSQSYICCWKGEAGKAGVWGAEGPGLRARLCTLFRCWLWAEEIMKETGRRLRGQMSG